MMMHGSSCASRKPAGAGVVPEKFPAGLRVLVVDDDCTCLAIVEKMLKKCNYEVTICNRADIGLSLLRENKSGFDIVLTDVHMPDMDGFKLLEHIGLEMDLPVIMMSVDDSSSVMMKGVTHGACDYLIKPIRLEALRNIWQHVVRRRKNEWKDFESVTSADDVDQHQKVKERDESSSSKKPRFFWSTELHQHFVSAVNQLGIDQAVPKKILDLMNVPGLSRENVSSHLQKYRRYLGRLSGSQKQHMPAIDQSNSTFSFDNSMLDQFVSGFNNEILMPAGQQSGSQNQNQPVLPNVLNSMENEMAFDDLENEMGFDDLLRET